MRRFFSTGNNNRTQEIIVAGVNVKITRKKIKNLNLSVRPPEGNVSLSIPYHCSNAEAIQFIQNNLPWICSKQDEVRQKFQKNNNFEDGGSVRYLGQDIAVKIEYKMGRNKIDLTQGGFVIRISPGTTEQEKIKLLDNWYRSELKKIIPRLLAKWQPIVGKEVDEWGIRKMRTRWGTCNIAAKRIWLNLELAKKNPDALEYVVVHELTHLHERYHNAHFKQLMTQFLPDWKERKIRLNLE
ncbi:SprT family zinc-dependent metalloprotease [Teredinibacter sp. KSP-S5-2]|uniref:M48 family metallopeptidase n=1 Tax=Teredinibacter sp. KSP-S5-2 TaxID=3034506 RepID=UPI0029350ABA|nr:SprT family zinc-dependent metalloprotease [Teredinibacter sp. KSP-S5-2]WNO08636.1 SprT family zinc-dependent metalloprotease [Teredinibacter sp. KSP-S5-2]